MNANSNKFEYILLTIVGVVFITAMGLLLYALTIDHYLP